MHEIRRGLRNRKGFGANWTGAEINSCRILTSLLDVPLGQAAQNVNTVPGTAGDKIESLLQ